VSEIHDQAAFYALGALDPDELDEFEAHLGTCERCRAELRRLSAGVALMAEAVAEPAPADLRERVMAEVGNGSLPAIDRPRRAWSRRLVALAAVAAVVVFILGRPPSQAERVEEILAASDLATVDVRGPAIQTGSFAYSDSLDQGVFTGTGLQAVVSEETYQLWLIGPDGPIPAGLFVPTDDGTAEVVVEGPIAPGVVLGMTVEPDGGSDRPTGPVVAGGEL
jgi:anti-sigma-K factor RskA